MTFQAGSIVTRIGGDLGPLRGAFAQAKGLAGEFVSGFGASIAAGIGAAVGVHALHGAMETIDAQNKAAARVGMTSEAYVALAHQANLAGVEQEGLNMALQHLQKGLVDAAAGTGPAAASFARLRLSAQQLVGLPVEETIGKIGDALQAIQNPAERASIAMDVFGARGGPQLLSLLSEGSAGIRQAREDAERLGITFNGIDGKKVEEANDSVSRLGAAARGLATQLAVKLAPSIDGVVKLMTRMVVGVRSIDPSVIEAAGSMLKWTAAIGAAVFVTPKLIAGWGAMVTGAKALWSAGTTLVKVFQELAKGQLIVQATMGPAGWASLAVSVAAATTAVLAIDAAFSSVASSADRAQVAIRDMVDATGAVRAASVRQTEEMGYLAQAFQALDDLKVDFFGDPKASERATQLIARADLLRSKLEEARKAAADLAKQQAAMFMPDQGEAQRTKAQFEVIGALQQQRDEAGRTREEVALLNLAWAGASSEVMEYARQAIGAAKSAEVLADLRKRVAQFGMTDSQKALADLRATPGVSPAAVGQAEELLGRLEKLDTGKKLADQAKQFLDGIKTPAEKAMDVVTALQEAFRQGKITAGEFDKGIAAAHDQAQKGVEAEAKQQQTRDLPSLVRAGSAEAVRVAFQAQRASGQDRYQQSHLAKLDTLIAAVQQQRPVELAMTEDD